MKSVNGEGKHEMAGLRAERHFDTDSEHLFVIFDGREIPLAFVGQESLVFLASPTKGSRWSAQLLRTGRVRLRINKMEATGSASLVTTTDEKREVMERFTSKYGARQTSLWYGSDYRIIRVDLSPDGDIKTEDDIYYRWLESEFDSIAADYDTHIYGNLVNSLLRERSLSLMRKTFGERSRLLEIGCGTGTETLGLLREGHEIVAVDISQRMLDTLKEKAKDEGLISQLTLFKSNAANMDSIHDAFGSYAFDGIYSTYGALNCVRNLHVIPAGFHRLIKPDGRLVMGIYNRFCIAEIAGYIARLKPHFAFRRLKSFAPEGESRFCVDVYAYTLPQIRKMFAEFFSLEYAEGVPVLIPPSNFVNYVKKFAGRIDTLKWIDGQLGRIWPLTILGDHFLTVMRSRELSSL